MNLVDGVTGSQRLGYHEDASVGRFGEGAVYVGYVQGFVFHEAVHALANHSQAFLYHLLEGASYGHYFAYTLHGRAYFTAYAVELAEVPAGYFTYYIVKSRLEESRSTLGDRVLEVEQTIAQTEFRSNESKGIAGSLGCKC